MDPDVLENRRRYRQQILRTMDGWQHQSARPADAYGSLRQDECWSPIPTHPADADVDANMRVADDMWPNPFSFRDAVENGGRWDYKQRPRQYENFGNFNYGATGTAWGFPAEILKEQAGKAQIERGHLQAGTAEAWWTIPQPGAAALLR